MEELKQTIEITVRTQVHDVVNGITHPHVAISNILDIINKNFFVPTTGKACPTESPLPQGLPDDDEITFISCGYEGKDPFEAGAKWMRSLAEKEMIKKDEEIKRLKMEAVGLFKLERVNELMGKASLSTWLAMGGDESEWKAWQTTTNKLNVN